MSDQSTFDRLCDLIVPFNKKNAGLTRSTTFANDLEFDSLTVMDFVAEIEDEFDIIIPLNLLPDLETIDDVAKAVERIVGERK